MQVVLTVRLTSLSPQDCTHHETVENKLSSNNFTSSFPTTGWNCIFHKIWKNIINIPTRNYGNVTFVPLDNICEIVKFAFPWWYDFFITNTKKDKAFFKKISRLKESIIQFATFDVLKRRVYWNRSFRSSIS